jgi:uncharacterized paraquat-inducible protein A
MLSGELLSTALVHPGKNAAPLEAGATLQTIVLIALGGIALLGALLLPFLRIRDWKMADNAYSLLALPLVLYREGAVSSAVIALTFLIVTPIAAWLAMAVWGWRTRRNQSAGLWKRWIQRLNQWSMLDVFGLALAIFLVEGDYLMTTEVRWGALFLVAIVVLKYFSESGVRLATQRSN